MIEAITLGVIQGVIEWLPLSSDGMLVLAQVNLFGSTRPLDEMLRYALFLHLGTVGAAIIYFRSELKLLVKAFFSYASAEETTRKLLRFLIATTVISGVLGYALYRFIQEAEDAFALTGKGITLATGALLLLTAALQFMRRGEGTKGVHDLHLVDAAVQGVAQGLAVLPGLSRSGITVATFLLRKFDDTTSLRVSFLMSIPIILAGNIALNISDFAFFTVESLLGVVVAFAVGLVSIHVLLAIAQKVRFGWFALFFGALMIMTAFIL